MASSEKRNHSTNGKWTCWILVTILLPMFFWITYENHHHYYLLNSYTFLSRLWATFFFCTLTLVTWIQFVWGAQIQWMPRIWIVTRLFNIRSVQPYDELWPPVSIGKIFFGDSSVFTCRIFRIIDFLSFQNDFISWPFKIWSGRLNNSGCLRSDSLTNGHILFFLPCNLMWDFSM